MGVVNGWKVGGKWKLRNNVQEFAIEKSQKERSQTEKKGRWFLIRIYLCGDLELFKLILLTVFPRISTWALISAKKDGRLIER